MSTAIAPPALFRASALAARDTTWLAEGFHLRVRVSPWIGFPLHPFAAWRLSLGETERMRIEWRDADGHRLPAPFHLEDANGQAEGFLFGAPADDPYIWAEVLVPDDRGLRVDLLDANRTAGGGNNRVLATRTAEPYRFGHAPVVRLRATGRGTIGETIGIRQSYVYLSELGDPDLIFGLPIKLRDYWYAHDPSIHPQDAARKRVYLGVPPRLSPPDELGPDTLAGGTDPTAEAERIMERIGPDFVDPWLTSGWGDPATAPAVAAFSDILTLADGQTGRATAPVTPSLLTMAVDPQIGRYLGLATLVPYGSTRPVEECNIWLVAARWAVQRHRIVHEPGSPFGFPITLGDVLGPSPSLPGGLDHALNHRFPDAPGIIADLPYRPGGESGPWSCRTLLALAVAAGDAQPDPPAPFPLAADPSGTWNPHADPQHPGPETWRQTVCLGDEPARGMVGFARTAPGKPVALHRFEPPPGQGHVSRAMPLVPNWAGNNRRVVEDDAVPLDADGASWRVWSADEFGQWSHGVDVGTYDLSAPLPARPAPPPPMLEGTFDAAPDDGTSGLRVPGTLRLRCTVPGPGHTAPGSVPIAELRVEVDGVVLPPRTVVQNQKVLVEAQPKAFTVGQQRAVPVTAWFVDTAGASSDKSTIHVLAQDARAPQAVPTSPVVIWTGRMDSTGMAELSLRWPPRTGAARYRIYLGDARRLAGSLTPALILPTSPVRAAQAKPLHAARDRLTDKGVFTFLAEIGGTADTDGLVHFSTRVPGGLRSVQFIRIVPLTAGGAETAFAACGLVPVAIPSADRPPPPLVDAVTTPDGGLALTIHAQGLRPELLTTGAGTAPEFRVRRTRTGADRHFAPVWTSGKLALPDGGGPWTATVTVPASGLSPFVHTDWYAEVRYPAEPPLPHGTTAEPVDDGVEPVWGAIGNEAEGLWSEPSLPAGSLLVPPLPPAAPATPVLTTAADGSVTLTLSGLPTAHPASGTPYRLEVYRGTPGSAPQERAVLPVESAALSWKDPAPVPASAHYDLVVVDPLGRRSPATRAA
ncbi:MULTISPECIES: hypothetical protein [Streptomyces]|uniref:hypothetical protein n=1 Tax=Streptomyces TaxID=1883 RepID=UPI0004C6D6F7|nr:hypothetical protein [Streptomyces sp. NRRL F-5527]